MADASGGDGDVRMRGFARRQTVGQAIAWLDAHTERLAAEDVALAQCAGRVLARDVTSDVDLPGFDRAMMDGFALRAAETLGASNYNRLSFRIVGEALPGNPFDGAIGRSEAVEIMTGAPMPRDADAVLPAEEVERDGSQVHARGEVPPGKHVGHRGEDVQRGTPVLAAGRVLRPQDVGLLSSIGKPVVPVVRRPRVRIVVTGGELLPAGSSPRGYSIADANGPMLAALVRRDGADPGAPVIVTDRRESILAALRTQAADADVVLVSGGSSVGAEDYVPGLIAEHGELAIHGIAMRPSSPTGLGRLDGKLVFLLPGNPVSCLCAYDFFAGRVIRAAGGRNRDWPYRSMTGVLSRKISSTVGRLDYARVRIVDGKVEPVSIGGASILSSTTRADGFVLVPDDSEGYPAGASVSVYLYDNPGP